MGIQKGLAAINKFKKDVEDRKKAMEDGKVDWLNIPDGKTYQIRFLQELDESGTGYVADNGLGFFATEHSNPDDFRKKALCTIEDGQCYGCEQSRAAYAGGDKDRGGKWKSRQRLYINVLSRDEDGNEGVSVMSQPAKGTVADMLLDYAMDEGTITDRWWKIKRSGQKQETTYSPRPGQPTDDVNPADYAEKVFDIEEKCVRSVPYEEQRAHYAVQATVVEDTRNESDTEKSVEPDDEQW